ncbi:hypothetical protein [Erwinia psidii]|uniref:hypothetical protein n=1 Tax=Erwinia psidii TaxID=69224 RepID=UPI0018F4DAD2|nr:hypothetical protein [Erwinia psidii]
MKEITGAANGYYEKVNGNPGDHSAWANRWFEAGKNAYNNRGKIVATPVKVTRFNLKKSIIIF